MICIDQLLALMNKVAFKNGEGDCRGDHKHGVVISEGLNYALKSYF